MVLIHLVDMIFEREKKLVAEQPIKVGKAIS